MVAEVIIVAGGQGEFGSGVLATSNGICLPIKIYKYLNKEFPRVRDIYIHGSICVI